MHLTRLRTLLLATAALALLASKTPADTTADSAATANDSATTTANSAAADSAKLQSQASNWITKQFGPFKFTAGPNDSGDFGANLDGKGEKDASLNTIQLVENVDKFWLPAFYNIGYSADGTWTSDSHTARNATASLKPGIDAGVFHGPYKPGTPQSDCAPHAPQCGTYSAFPIYWLGGGEGGEGE
jgi:hypothetical protein